MNTVRTLPVVAAFGLVAVDRDHILAGPDGAENGVAHIIPCIPIIPRGQLLDQLAVYIDLGRVVVVDHQERCFDP